MLSFTEYIMGNTLPRPDNKELEAILTKYPWFIAARKMMAEAAGKKDMLIELHYLSHPRRSPTLVEPNPVGSPGSVPQLTDMEDAPVNKTESDIIDSFLLKEDVRIVPDEQTPEYDAALTSSLFELSEEMLSEELAAIYQSQGLNEQARQIYERLSLLYPEKSIYFAEIISEINKAEGERNN